jgi:hypothetical protein
LLIHKCCLVIGEGLSKLRFEKYTIIALFPTFIYGVATSLIKTPMAIYTCKIKSNYALRYCLYLIISVMLVHFHSLQLCGASFS